MLPLPLKFTLTYLFDNLFGDAGQPVQNFPFQVSVTSAPTNAMGASFTSQDTTQEALSIQTDLNGDASVQFTLGNTPGQYQITAACFLA